VVGTHICVTPHVWQVAAPRPHEVEVFPARHWPALLQQPLQFAAEHVFGFAQPVTVGATVARHSTVSTRVRFLMLTPLRAQSGLVQGVLTRGTP